MPTKSFKLLYLLLLFPLMAFSPGAALPDFRLKTIVLDAGHGGKDPGTHGKKAREKEVALAVVLKLGKLLKEK